MKTLALAALLGLTVLAGGCADTVDPTLGTEQAFSLYGYLDPTADRQAIRVVPIAASIDADTARTIDAVVTSTEAATGRTVSWRDSAVTYADGSVGHVFVADYSPSPGATVAFTVRASDERTASVTVEVPLLARPTVGAPLPGEPAGVFPVSVAGVPRLLGGSLRLTVLGLPGTAPNEPSQILVPIPAGALELRQAGATWTAAVPFVQATRAHLQSLGLFRAGLELKWVEFMPFVANAAWAVPPGGFDLDRIVEPGTFSNVAGGFGFVGAGYRTSVGWLPSALLQDLAGFQTLGALGAQLAINEIGAGYVEMYNPTATAIRLDGYILTMGLAADGAVVPPGSVVPPKGFLVVNGPFQVEAEGFVRLLTASGAFLKQVYMNKASAVWGAYPDGYSYRPPQGDLDIFYGPVTRSPGGPNRLLRVPAVVNEVASGEAPFVEVARTSETEEELLIAALSGFDLVLGSDPTGTGRLLASEAAGARLLDPLGGEVFVIAISEADDRQRVVDVRAYGPREPNRSEGYLPDGPGGAWTTGLRPTPRAPNAAARLGP